MGSTIKEKLHAQVLFAHRPYITLLTCKILRTRILSLYLKKGSVSQIVELHVLEDGIRVSKQSVHLFLKRYSQYKHSQESLDQVILHRYLRIQCNSCSHTQLHFAETHLAYFFEDVIWSDETTVHVETPGCFFLLKGR